MSILIKNVQLNGAQKDVLITKNIITKIAKVIKTNADIVIDGTDKAVIPGLINGHTHAAMTLFRGYADDASLGKWLKQKIWPLERKLTEQDVYLGTRLACLEMIKSGTTFFNDMYWHFMGSAKAVEEMGIRAVLSAVFIDIAGKDQAKEQIKINKELFEKSRELSDRIIFALGPHAIYTVSKQSLQWIKGFAHENNLLIHIHVSETEKEVHDCISTHGKRPLEYLESIGFLGPNVIACHAIWLNENELNLCKKYDVKIVYNPVSNLKLAAGQCFQYQKMVQKGINPLIGTDGCASNNNLDMFESIKFAALLQKSCSNDPTVLPAQEALKMASINGAKAFRFNVGEIKQGKLADLLLIDLNRPEFVPHYNLHSSLVYSANGYCVDTTICDGKILMQGRKVNNEQEILQKAEKAAKWRTPFS